MPKLSFSNVNDVIRIIFKKSFVQLIIYVLGYISPFALSAQVTGKNLIPNGAFESGNIGFESSYSYAAGTVSPGTYSVTDQASLLNKDFKDPDGGDHTEGGYGLFFVANADGSSGRSVWSCKVEVLPNSEYDFAVFFCNIYRLLPPKTNFAFENGDVKGNDPRIKVMIGSEEILVERDYFHMFRWIKASTVWYSGEHNGQVRITIENLNTNINGNDLALDDISLVYIRTMPAGYKPPEKITSIMSRDYQRPVVKRKVPLSDYGIELGKGDSLNNGVYTIQYKKPAPEIVDSVVADTHAVAKIDRVILRNILFMQSKADLLPQAKKELDGLAEWLNRDTDVRVRFIGHTDNQGDPRLNILLSEQRVTNVKKYLVSKGIAENRIETVGYGGAFPIADNTWEETRKLNRRVEMEILK